MVRYYCPTCWRVVDQAAVRCTACGAALDEKNRDIVLRYMDALRNPEPTRAALACEMLAKLGDKRAVRPLVMLIESRPQAYEVLCAAVKALGQFGLPDTVGVLVAVLQDTQAAIPARVEALHALVSFGGQTAMRALDWAAMSDRPSLRAYASDPPRSQLEEP